MRAEQTAGAPCRGHQIFGAWVLLIALSVTTRVVLNEWHAQSTAAAVASAATAWEHSEANTTGSKAEVKLDTELEGLAQEVALAKAQLQKDELKAQLARLRGMSAAPAAAGKAATASPRPPPPPPPPTTTTTTSLPTIAEAACIPETPPSMAPSTGDRTLHPTGTQNVTGKPKVLDNLQDDAALQKRLKALPAHETVASAVSEGVCIAGCAKNVQGHWSKTEAKLDAALPVFARAHTLLYTGEGVNNVADHTVKLIDRYAAANRHVLHIKETVGPEYPHRTTRLARCRNALLSACKLVQPRPKFLLMLDLDDIIHAITDDTIRSNFVGDGCEMGNWAVASSNNYLQYNLCTISSPTETLT
jgi:hypothetical protein